MSQDAVIRYASHAGSWYSSSRDELDSQLREWLNAVKLVKDVDAAERRSRAARETGRSEDVLEFKSLPGKPVFEYVDTTSSEKTKPTLRLELGEALEEVPVPGARLIIAPHAGYSYSGPAAAWAYRSWDVSQAQRVFLLGPSHHYYLDRAALSRCTQYATPIGNLNVDRETTEALAKTRAFEYMNQTVDEEEHSLEMHLPYIYKRLSQHFEQRSQRRPNPGELPPLVPIMIGNTNAATEKQLGQILAPYLADPNNAFVISSDFAHWGLRFRYTHYKPNMTASGHNLRSSDKVPKGSEDFAIHESIQAVDFECMQACESGSHDEWLAKLAETGNTVCGRHPIGVIMAAVEEVRKQEGKQGVGAFKFVQYAQSSKVKRVGDSSVSYASAYAVI